MIRMAAVNAERPSPSAGSPKKTSSASVTIGVARTTLT